MKKRLIIFSVLAVILIAVFILLSGYLKAVLLEKAESAINESINARVVWDHDQFSISFFDDFPHITAVMSDIGVVNNAPFENEVLFVAEEFRVSVDPWKLINSKIRINGISLVNPIIQIRINEAGDANYDIATRQGPASPTEEATDYDISIDHWEIINGTVIYEDLQSSAMLELHHVNHNGRGNFNPGEVSVEMQINSDSVYFSQNKTTFLRNKTISLDLKLDIEDDYTRYILGRNSLRINDFILNATGEVKLLDEEGYNLKLSFSTPENDFSNMLSIVPGIYTDNFKDIRTTGRFSFAADIDGMYNSQSIPSFTVELNTTDASFQYDGLPVGVENIQLDVLAKNTSGIQEETRVEINQLSMHMGASKIESRLILENLKDYSLDGMARFNIDLGELTSVFPMDEQALDGLGKLDLSVKGSYDSVRKVMPAIDGSLILENVFVEDKASGYRMRNVNLSSTFANPTGRFTDFAMTIPSLSFVFEDQLVSADGRIGNLDNLNWLLNAKGQIDLYKMLSLFNITDYGVESGDLKFDIHTKGNLEALENESYTDLPTSGELSLTGFAYSDPSMTGTLKIDNGLLGFTPSHISLNQLDATLGQSNFQMKGRIENYLNYILSESETLQANIDLNSTMLNLDEFMNADYSEDTITVSSDDSFRIPADLDVIMNARISKIIVSGIGLDNFLGKARIANEKVVLSDLTFRTLGGRVSGEGEYQTRSLPASIDMKLKAENMDISSTARSVDFTRTYMPVLSVINSSYSADFELSGDIMDDCSIELTSINSDAIVESSAATFEPSNLTDKFVQLSGIGENSFRDLEDVMMHLTIRDGHLYVEPFDVKIGKYKAKVFGTNGLDGSMAYEMTVIMPAGEIGQQLNKFITDNGGTVNQDEIPITFGIGGTWKKPEVVLLKNEQHEAITQAIKQKAAGEAENVARELLDNVKDEDTKALITSILGDEEPKDSLQTAASDSTKANASDLKEKALNEVKSFFKKKKKEENE